MRGSLRVVLLSLVVVLGVVDVRVGEAVRMKALDVR